MLADGALELDGAFELEEAFEPGGVLEPEGVLDPEAGTGLLVPWPDFALYWALRVERQEVIRVSGLRNGMIFEK